MSTPYPPMPAAPTPPPEPDPVPPAELRLVVVLLLVNLGLSIALTVASLALKTSIVDYQLDHRHVTDPDVRESLRNGYTGGLVGRVVGNVVVSVVYAFLVRALLRGRRWAYRRVILIGGLGIVGLLISLVQPYPAWMHGEAVLQALVLAGLLWAVLRPEVRAHFDPSLPGRDVKRFGRT